MRIILLLASLSINVYAEPRVSFEELCEYDSYCKTANKEKIESERVNQKKKMLYRMAYFLREDIRKAADLLDVPAEAIAGAFITENTLNVDVKDKVQEILYQANIDSEGESGSVGLGQMNKTPLRKADEILAKYEERDMHSTAAKRSKDYSNPYRGVYYIAAYLRYAADTYKEIADVDISNDSAILATLYNIGKVEIHARNLSKKPVEERIPRVNYFGWYLETIEKDVKKVVNETEDIIPKILKDKDKVYFVAFDSKKIKKVLPCIDPNQGASDKEFLKENIRLNKVLNIKERPVKEWSFLEEKSNKELLSNYWDIPEDYFKNKNKIDKLWSVGETLDCEDRKYKVLSDGEREFYMLAKDFESETKYLGKIKAEIKENCSIDINSCMQKVQRTFPESEMVISQKNEFRVKFKPNGSSNTYVDHTTYNSKCEYMNEEELGKIVPIQYEEFRSIWDDLDTVCRQRLEWADFMLTGEFADLYIKINRQINEKSMISGRSFEALKEIRRQCNMKRIDVCDEPANTEVCSTRETFVNNVTSFLSLDDKTLCGVKKVLLNGELENLISEASMFAGATNCSFSLIKNFDYISKMNKIDCIDHFKIPNKQLAILLSNKNIDIQLDLDSDSTKDFTVVMPNMCEREIPNVVMRETVEDVINLDKILDGE